MDREAQQHPLSQRGSRTVCAVSETSDEVCPDCGHDAIGKRPKVLNWLRSLVGLRPLVPWCPTTQESDDGISPTETCFCTGAHHG